MTTMHLAESLDQQSAIIVTDPSHVDEVIDLQGTPAPAALPKKPSGMALATRNTVATGASSDLLGTLAWWWSV
ncbi:hypothetical protein [Cutibacterium sp. V970]|uniref:hypothetical protein n=1 Tax=Cutibacterium sp. V970 TaxID=3446481 RepID=UPI003F4FCF8E